MCVRAEAHSGSRPSTRGRAREDNRRTMTEQQRSPTTQGLPLLATRSAATGAATRCALASREVTAAAISIRPTWSSGLDQRASASETRVTADGETAADSSGRTPSPMRSRLLLWPQQLRVRPSHPALELPQRRQQRALHRALLLLRAAQADHPRRARRQRFDHRLLPPQSLLRALSPGPTQTGKRRESPSTSSPAVAVAKPSRPHHHGHRLQQPRPLPPAERSAKVPRRISRRP